MTPFQLPLLFSIVLVLQVSVGFVSANHARENTLVQRHHARAASEQVANVTGDALQKRVSNARFTFYQTGMGSCGQYSQPSDFIVALNSAQYNGGQYCFQTITITCNGKTTQAQIVDECPGCPYGGLDFSEGLFDFCASESAGVIYGDWDFGSGAAPSSSSTPPPPPSTTSSKPPPTSIQTTSSTPPPPPSTTSTPPPTSTSTSYSSPTSSSSSSHSGSSSSSYSTSESVTSSTSSSAAPVETNSSSPQLLSMMNTAVIQLGALTGDCLLL